ncbi:MAG: AsmA family protein, partial [Betaproteobacteria bacterium]|nr:AsmA family protein [Betaproteobacteria bacterium]
VVLVVGSVAIAALGITLSASPWRGQLSDAMGHAIGREVRFEGPLEMQPTLTPSFRVGGITIANPAGFSSPFFASLAHSSLQVDLLALLRGEVRVRELSAQGVIVHLERNARGQVNWLLQLASKDEADKAPGKKAPLRLVEVQRIALKELLVDYVGGPKLATHSFTLDDLQGEGGEGKPISLKMNGTVEKSFPYTVSVTGGTLSTLSQGGVPWPLEFALEFAGTSLVINGEVLPDAGRTSANLTFGLGTDNLSQLERLLQVHLPPVGATGLSGKVAWEKGVLDIRDLRGAMGNSVLEGQLRLDLTQSVARVKGEIHLPVFDVTPFRAKTRMPEPEEAGKPVDLEALKKRQFQFRELSLVEADLSLTVYRWMGLPGDVRESTLQVSLHGGVLKAPVKATIARVPLEGEIGLDGAAENPSFLLNLGARKTTLVQLARLLTGASGVQGNLGHFLLHFAATGKNLPALANTLEMKLEIADGQLSYGNVEGGRPVEVRLDRADIALPAGGRLQGKIRGTLLREPFTADFMGGDLLALGEEISWPVEIRIVGSGATLSIQGQVAAPGKDAGTDLAIRFNSPRAGDVARWLGLSPKSRAPVAIAGRVQVQSDEWRLSDLLVQLGQTKLAGNFARVWIGGKPLVQATLRVENLELAELESMLPPPKPGPSKPVIELPILPKGIDLTDADIDVGIQRIALSPAPVTGITFAGKIREGKMYASPFSAMYAGTTLNGALALDLREDEPQAAVWVAARQVDIGRMLRTLRLVESLDVKADLLQLQLLAKGHRLGEMLDRSALQAAVESGEMVVRDASGKGGLSIRLTKGQVEAKPKQPVHLYLDGLIDKTPVKISLASGSVSELARGASHVPFNLAVETAGTKLSLSGKVSLPISKQEAELELSVAGSNINSLDELARTSLPHWGPYALSSRFRMSKAGYDMPGMTLKVGSSELKGKGSVATGGTRPKIDVQLSAPKVQLDDFKLEGWALAEKKPAKEEKKLSEEELRAKAKQASSQTQAMLSPATLKRQDMALVVEVGEVLSGADRLGGGSLHASLYDGKLVLGPVEVNVPGGSVKLAMGYRPTESAIALDAKIRVDRFDYGVLARRLKPGSDLQGLFSLQMDLASNTPSLYHAMQNGDGRVDFAVWPKNMKSGIFDLWAVNLFVALIPAVDPASESKVNCAVGRFDLKNGVLTEDSILLDTSRMRVKGKARVDFDSETLALQLEPTPKKAQFFSLATPIAVTGKITDPKILVSAAAVAGTTARLLTSIVTTPFERLFSKSIPRDGADVCANALKQNREPRT